MQRESVVTWSYDPSTRDPTEHKWAAVKMRPAELAGNVSHLGQAGRSVKQQESGIVRIPSPLLYHRRSEATSAEPLREQQLIPKLRELVFDKYNSKHTQLMSEIRAAGQEKQPGQVSPSAFVAARLPLLGEALSADQSEDGDVGLERQKPTSPCSDIHPSAALHSPPVITTNTYMLPERVCNVVSQPHPAWSGPVYSNVNMSWGSDKIHAFSKFVVPGREYQHQSKSTSGGSSDQATMLWSVRPVKCANLIISMPASMSAPQESRERSSTQDSFDSKFNVATATRKLNIPAMADSICAQVSVRD